MSLETWLAFFAACWVISLSPGAGAIASMSCGLQYETYKVVTYPRSDCGYLPQSQHSEAPVFTGICKMMKTAS